MATAKSRSVLLEPIVEEVFEYCRYDPITGTQPHTTNPFSASYAITPSQYCRYDPITGTQTHTTNPILSIFTILPRLSHPLMLTPSPQYTLPPVPTHSPLITTPLPPSPLITIIPQASGASPSSPGTLLNGQMLRAP